MPSGQRGRDDDDASAVGKGTDDFRELGHGWRGVRSDGRWNSNPPYPIGRGGHGAGESGPDSEWKSCRGHDKCPNFARGRRTERLDRPVLPGSGSSRYSDSFGLSVTGVRGALAAGGVRTVAVMADPLVVIGDTLDLDHRLQARLRFRIDERTQAGQGIPEERSERYQRRALHPPPRVEGMAGGSNRARILRRWAG